MKKAFLIVIVVLLVSPAFTHAQEAICNPAKLLGAISQAKTTGDPDQDWKLIAAVEEGIRAFRAACAEYRWEGKGEVLTEVFDLPAGIYKAEFSSSDTFIGTLEVIAGECDMDSFSGWDGNTASEIIRSEGCTAAFQIGAVHAPWTITIIPLKK